MGVGCNNEERGEKEQAPQPHSLGQVVPLFELHRQTVCPERLGQQDVVGNLGSTPN